MAKKREPKQCDYCGAEFEPYRDNSRFCRDSHRIYAFRKTQLERLKMLEGKE